MPAVYDLDRTANVVLLSVTEGEDKPLKYPVMFKAADLVVVTKTDLLEYLPDISVAPIHDSLAHVMPAPRVIELSARTGCGLTAWIEWLLSTESLAAPADVPPGAAPHAHV